MARFTNINDYVEKTRGSYGRASWLTPSARIGDYILSIQASSGHYCLPRKDHGPWTAFEIGYPNRVIPELLPYAEFPNEPEETIYVRVPASVIDQLIADNGGFIEEA